MGNRHIGGMMSAPEFRSKLQSVAGPAATELIGQIDGWQAEADQQSQIHQSSDAGESFLQEQVEAFLTRFAITLFSQGCEQAPTT